MLPFEPTANAPTIAQSWARRLNFWYAQPPAPDFGTRISVSSSSGASAVSRKPSKKSAAAMVRSPDGPRTDERRVEREQHRGQVRRGVAVRDGATDRAAVTDLVVADLRGNAAQHAALACQQRRWSRGRGAGSARRSPGDRRSSRT